MIKKWEKELRKIALSNFKIKKKKLKKLKITFKKRSSFRSLGSYSPFNKTIYINRGIYEISGEKYYFVFRHEYGHFLADLLHKNINPHGLEWRNIMKLLGDEKPRATTNFFLDDVLILKQKKRRF